MEKIIEVHNLSKNYKIGEEKERYYSLREEMIKLAKKPIQWLKGEKTSKKDFWALKDVSFSVKKGEVIGVIGRNGAGKTTLLKVLSKITPPTEGRAIIRGRINSLLEVGTGFHPELKGRENIYLSGAILGMTKKEIDSKFDEIVKFSEIGEFLDTPVKRYSSGMYVKLAFAVAAHLEPEVLFVDEVLAVGDFKFQKKCLEKMSKVSQEGRTILFVSHNMDSVARLCNRSILLEKGRLIMEGPTPDVIEKYTGLRKGIGPEINWENPIEAPGDPYVKLKSVRVLSKEKRPASKLEVSEDFYIELTYWNFLKGAKLLPCIRLVNNEGVYVLSATNLPSVCSEIDHWYDRPCPEGLFRCVCRIPGDLLKEGHYFINIIIGNLAGVIDSFAHVYEDQILSFEIIDKKNMHKEHNRKILMGVVQPRLSWKTEYQEQSSSLLK